jgi:hypothetical protein
MELKEAVETINKWLEIADNGCSACAVKRRTDEMQQRYYDIYLAKWNAFQQVLELLSKVEGE